MSRATFLMFVCCMLGLVALGCSKPAPPTVTPEVTSITSIGPAGVTVRATLSMHNPNGFALTAQSVTATITLDNKVKTGPVVKPQGIDLPANATTIGNSRALRNPAPSDAARNRVRQAPNTNPSQLDTPRNAKRRRTGALTPHDDACKRDPASAVRTYATSQSASCESSKSVG